MLRALAHHLAFTDRQRNVLLVLLVIGLAYAGIRWAMHRSTISDPQPEAGARAVELADRIDPDTADWQTLAILPGIAEKKAKGIVEWRERNRAAEGGRVFRRVEDLVRVPGIGAATVDKLRPYLFIPDPPSTAPVN
jgi:competence ComEA-like helix-hairpin-helix protein